MRQIICNMQGALVARVPRPAVGPGQILVRVRYSLVSTGTEIASLKPQPCPDADTSTVDKAVATASLAARYLGLAMRYPDRAVIRSCQIVKNAVCRLLPEKPAPQPTPLCDGKGLTWSTCGAVSLEVADGMLRLTSDDSEFGYQAMTAPLAVEPGMVPVVRMRGEVLRGSASIGLLDESGQNWLGSRNYDQGLFDDRLIFDPKGSAQVTLVVANAGAKARSELRLDEIEIMLSPPVQDGLPLSELDQQGWNVGYSAAGEVVALGRGVTEFSVGDLVACGGAGLANHADYVAVPKNLACRVPAGCSLQEAATTTVGTIALQGVRRAEPTLGETCALIGLGLIGQLAAQILEASGVTVLGLDLDPDRVRRARDNGMTAGETDPARFKALVRDATGGHGADMVVVTAATKSDAPANLALEVARRKGRVVIVGDVGMHFERPQFYKKELDVRMSTSYGPGRYDREYEAQGRDYPLAYVRWTINRNMAAYLDLMARKRINAPALVDRVVAVDEAPAAYKELATATASLPLGVLIRYPDEARDLPEAPDAARITIRGHKPPPADGLFRYALVGAGAFGQSMLVPMMDRRKDRFFLRAVVSRDAVRGGNFARARQAEILTTDVAEACADPNLDLLVIATRHNEHAAQVLAGLRAGKHVFVEKPLCLTWEELEEIERTVQGLETPPLLMVGFNRRFSPALEAVRQALAGRRGPVFATYRLNGGYIPGESWVQTDEGGGRNLGEACHMYDVFRSLADAPVADISATAIDPGKAPYFRNDNFAATLRYADGSVGNLVYTALGPKAGLPKERLEIFCDGEAYVVDDYVKAWRASDGAVLWEGEVDKGHAREFSLFGDALADGGPAPIPLDQIIETTAAALHVEDLLRS